MKRQTIPLKVRLAVLERMAFVDREFKKEAERQFVREWYQTCSDGHGLRTKIRWLIWHLFHRDPVELDHDPALVLRRFNKRTGHYIPHENNPKFLIYRVKARHLQKTTGRMPGAERTVTTKGSDIWLAKKFRKLEHPKKSRPKIQSRPFPTTKRTIRTRTSSSATHARKGS